jgi:hypothetical protein
LNGTDGTTGSAGVRIALMVARIAGLFALILGIAFWTGNGLTLVNAHMGFGLLVVIALWVLAGFAGRAGVGASTVILAVLWGCVVPILGVVQLHLPPTGGYGLVRVIHLLVGLGALALAETLGGRIKRARARSAL